jgi:small-conductance mechanosensitive channel
LVIRYLANTEDEEEMTAIEGVRSWSGFIAYSVLIMAVTVVLYWLGFSAVVFLPAAIGVAGLALGEHYRHKPNIMANRVAYVMLFAFWVGLAVFLLLSALFVNSGMLQPSALGVAVFAIVSLAVGGAVGEWVGRRRGYQLPNWD